MMQVEVNDSLYKLLELMARISPLPLASIETYANMAVGHFIDKLLSEDRRCSATTALRMACTIGVREYGYSADELVEIVKGVNKLRKELEDQLQVQSEHFINDLKAKGMEMYIPPEGGDE